MPRFYVSLLGARSRLFRFRLAEALYGLLERALKLLYSRVEPQQLTRRVGPDKHEKFSLVLAHPYEYGVFVIRGKHADLRAHHHPCRVTAGILKYDLFRDAVPTQEAEKRGLDLLIHSFPRLVTDLEQYLMPFLHLCGRFSGAAQGRLDLIGRKHLLYLFGGTPEDLLPGLQFQKFARLLCARHNDDLVFVFPEPHERRVRIEARQSANIRPVHHPGLIAVFVGKYRLF